MKSLIIAIASKRISLSFPYRHAYYIIPQKISLELYTLIYCTIMSCFATSFNEFLSLSFAFIYFKACRRFACLRTNGGTGYRALLYAKSISVVTAAYFCVCLRYSAVTPEVMLVNLIPKHGCDTFY